MKIEKHLHRDEPIIEIEIVCDWNYGYDDRGIERIRIPTKVMKQLIEEIEGVKKK